MSGCSVEISEQTFDLEYKNICSSVKAHVQNADQEQYEYQREKAQTVAAAINSCTAHWCYYK